MTSYPPTTLPPSLPYPHGDAIVTMLCDRCLSNQYDPRLPEADKMQLFELTMSLIDFWEKEGVLRVLQ